ncbi:hypothetical protein G5V58_25010 [Nocardioides anomalus]|uniref:Carboxypeptidase regulatory-like domain-containing protein n=1 Tax=Nocardioides anomalus TaxID=2712223 RepID=A0A6G6WJR0_9ACTN|nr:hypothetical protein [Nocardioides anomalus]QIG45571.1 hypothetical protein G5V58_25010 [Nocardioides anomalus]
MNRLHLHRGLAATAVAALAATGLAVAGPAAPSQAAGPGVVLLSQLGPGSDASVRYDGLDETVTLTAEQLDPAATVSFQYNANPQAGDATTGWTDIAGTVATTGTFAQLDWTPDAALVGKEVAVRAVATVGGAATYSTRQGVAIARGDWGTEAVAARTDFIDTGDTGYFVQPYASSGHTATQVGVEGETSATAGTVEVGWWNPASQSFQGKVNASVEAYDLKTLSPSTQSFAGGQFHAALDITAFGAADGKAIAIGAVRDTDDVQARTLHPQTIGSISAGVPSAPAGQAVPVTISVYDNAGGPSTQPVAGAEIRRSGDGSLVGYTDGAGLIVDTAVAGSVGSYYVNTTDADAYEAGTDLETTPSSYTSSVNEVSGVSVDGHVFDDDEYAAGDLRLALQDSYGRPVPAGQVEYRLYPTGGTPPATYETTTSDARGLAPIAFASSGPDGDYTVEYRLPGGGTTYFLTFTAGDATLTPNPATATAAPGSQVPVKAALAVAGKPLSGRRVSATYQRGIELVPGTTADAALVDGSSRTLSLTGVTDVFGGVGVTVADPAQSPQPAELGGKLVLASQPATGGPLTGNANETVTVPIAFGSAADKGQGKVKLKAKNAGKKDKLIVKGDDSLAGETVVVFRVGGKKVKLKGLTLNAKGDAVVKVKDKNGRAATTYVVKLLSSERVVGSKSKKVTLR